MAQIIIEKMYYSYKEFYESIFENVNLNLDSDWKLGLIGRNGRGKTTLLKLLHGELEPDQGRIIRLVKTELFPFPVNKAYTNTMDVMKENIGGLRTLEDHLDDMECLSEYLERDGFEMESRIKKEMNLMELSEDLLDRDFDTLSGGEMTKVCLICLFLKDSTFILLDEPTNHLDLEGKRIVADYLRKKKGFIVVSHDRKFLDTVCNHVLSINKKTIEIEHGNYSTWKNNKDLIEQFEARTKERLEREITSLDRRAAKNRVWARVANTQKYPFAGHFRTNGSRAYMRQAKNSESRIQANIKEKKKLLLNYEKEKHLQISQDKTTSGWLLYADHLSFGYDEKTIIEDFNLVIYPGDIIWLRGRNGIGKSTLLRLLSKNFQRKEQHCAHKGMMSGNVYYAAGIEIAEAYQEPLCTTGYVQDLFTTDNHYWKELCLSFDLPSDFLERPLDTFSSGELKKIEIARALSQPNHLLFLDEPLNYMDIHFRIQLEKAIMKYKPTMIFVEHDEQFGETVSNVVIDLG